MDRGPWKGHKAKKRLPGNYAPPAGKAPFSRGPARKGPRPNRD